MSTDVDPWERLAMTDAEVAALTRPEREARLAELVQESQDIPELAIEEHVTGDGRMVAAVVVLFSGGNDSTVLAHLFRARADYAGHANTTVGIEDTRQYVRDTCEAWGLPLLERTSPRKSDQYAALVRDQGFPGPGHHFKMYQRLKERVIELLQRELVGNPYRYRVVFLAGRRRQESKRRAAIPAMERNRSKVYVSPLVNWTKLDMNTYRLVSARNGDPVPTNAVSDLIHMSGECMCGAFASAGERAEVSRWYPAVFEQIAALEAEVADNPAIPAHRKTWGWGADPATLAVSRKRGRHAAHEQGDGLMCSSCATRFEEET